MFILVPTLALMHNNIPLEVPLGTIDLDVKFYANEVAYVEINGKVQKLQVI